MKVELAGMNVPVKVLEKLTNDYLIKELGVHGLTPEVISAAYARISRSKKSVDELVDMAIADTPSARESVTAILGIGHHSIADHAIFDFSIMGVSRLLVESIEERRLAAYTEKSQRYVTLDGDYIRPKEFSSEDLEKFEELVAFQNAFYFRNNEKLFNYLKKKFSKEIERLERKERKDFLTKLESSAKEDARYSLCLATETQLGCSYTGQTAELAIRKLKYGRLEEEKELSKLLYDSIVKVAPSLIQLSDPELFKKFNPGRELKDDNFKFTRKNLEELVDKTFKNYYRAEFGVNWFSLYNEGIESPSFKKKAEVNLVAHNNPDKQIIASLLHSNSKRSALECYITASYLIKKEKAKDFIKEALKHISEFDKVPREFEAGYLIYEFPLSASCFAQLKRHRMNTLLVQDYNPELGITVPLNIAEIDAARELEEVCNRSSDLYYKFLPKYGKAAEYCLTNAHRRRVIVATNLRQLYHISRTREDEHAQWEILGIAQAMSQLAKQVAPFTTILLGGKHEFERIRKKVYEK